MSSGKHLERLTVAARDHHKEDLGKVGRDMHRAVTDFLRSSSSCLLLVHPDVPTLSRVASELLPEYAWPQLAIGLELSSVLVAEMPTRRSRAARQWLEARLAGLAPGPVLCTDTDLLFNPALELDPVALLSDLSRVVPLVVTWPGNWRGERLTYAVPAHSYYRVWRSPRVTVAPLDTANVE